MKKIFLLLFTSVFISCSDDSTGGVSKVTNYPIITVTGDDPIFVAKGGTFTDPGAVAMEGENEIAHTTTINGNYRGGTSIDTNITDEYTITYSATNVDGFSTTASRKVIVYNTGDLVNSIEGVYISTVTRNGNLLNPAQGSSVDMKYIYIWKNTNGIYEVSDAFGGWYTLGRKLGLGYITPGGKINATSIPGNVFTFPGNPLTNLGFGGIANITGLTVDPVTKQVVLTCSWDAAPGYTFVSTLTQVQL